MLVSRSLKLGSRISARSNTFSVRYASSSAAPDVTLYQYEVCPFCCGLKAVMDFYDVHYKTVEVNPLNKAELKASKEITDKTYKKVPIAVINGEQINDSRVIMSKLQDLEVVAKPDETVVADIDWAYKSLAILFPPNIYRSMSESFEAFKYVSEHKDWSPFTQFTIQVSGSLVMRALAGKMLKKYSTETDPRKALYNAITEWERRLEESNGQFRGGEKPNQADIVIYGMFTAMNNMTTLKDCLANHQKFKDWFFAVKEQVGTSARLPKNVL